MNPASACFSIKCAETKICLRGLGALPVERNAAIAEDESNEIGEAGLSATFALLNRKLQEAQPLAGVAVEPKCDLL